MKFVQYASRWPSGRNVGLQIDDRVSSSNLVCSTFLYDLIALLVLGPVQPVITQMCAEIGPKTEVYFRRLMSLKGQNEGIIT